MSQGLVLHLQPLLKELLQSFRTQGHLVAQSVKHLTLDFSSGHDLRVLRLSSTLGSELGVEPA